MKKYLFSVFALLFVFGLTVSGYAQNDPIYGDGSDMTTSSKKSSKRAKEDKEFKNAQNLYDDEDYVDDEARDYRYASRIRRFNQPARGFGYYSNYYVDSYWYDPFQPGMSIYAVNSYNPYCYNGWNNGWYGYNNWNNGWYGYNGWNSWNGYNGWNNGWYGYNGWGYNNYWGGHHHHHNNWGSNNYFYESSLPNAANFVTTRYTRGSDAGVNNSRGSRVGGYDTDQRTVQPNNNPNATENPAVYERGTLHNGNTATNTNVRPNASNRTTTPPSYDNNSRGNTRGDILTSPNTSRDTRTIVPNNSRNNIQKTPSRPERENNPVRTIPPSRHESTTPSFNTSPSNSGGSSGGSRGGGGGGNTGGSGRGGRGG